MTQTTKYQQLLLFEINVTITDDSGGVTLLDFEHSTNTDATAQSALDAIHHSIARQLQLLPTVEKVDHAE